MASSPPKQDSTGLLARGDSTKMDEESIIDYFTAHFKEGNKEPPENFDICSIGLFLRVLSDPQLEKRLDASFVIYKLLGTESAELIHTIVQKGVLDVIGQCTIGGDEKVLHNCVMSARRITRHCPECNEKVGRKGLLDTIVELMHSHVDLQRRVYRNLILFCQGILYENAYYTAPVISKISCLLVKVIAEGMRRFATDIEIQESSLSTITNLLCLLASSQSDRVVAIDAIFNEKDLIENTFDAIPSGNPSHVNAALVIFKKIISLGRKNHQTALLTMREGFIDMISECLESSFSTVRFRSARVLRGIASSPACIVSVLLKNINCLTQLMYLMYHEDAQTQKEVCWVWANLLFYLNNYEPRPEQREEYIRDGIRKIVDFQIEHKADSRLVNQIREVLPKLLLSHSEFMCVLQTKEILNMLSDEKKVETETEKDRGESIAFIISEEPETESG